MSGIRIPLTNGTSGGSIGGGISANSGTQGLKATAQLFGTMGNVAQQGFDTQVKLERIEQSRKLNNLKSGIKKITAEYQNELLKNKDSTTWEPNYEKKLSKFLGENNAQDLSPEAREQWDMWHGDYIAGQKLRIARDATIQGLKNAELDLNNNMRIAEDRADFQESDRLRHESGLFTKEELEKGDLDSQKRYESWEKQEKRNYFNKILDQDPQTFLAAISSKDENGEYEGYVDEMDLEERKVMIKKAEREVISRRNDEGNLIKERITTGEISSPQQLQEMRDNGKINYLTDADVKALKSHLTRDVPTSDVELIGSMQMIDDLADKRHSMSDTEYVKEYLKVENHVLGITQKGRGGWLKQRLYMYNPNYKAGKSGSSNPFLKEGKAEAMEEATKHLGILFKNGDFGDVDNGEEGSDKKFNVESAKTYREIQRDVEQWVEKQEKSPTIDQVHEYMGQTINRKTGYSGVKKLFDSIQTNPSKSQKRFNAGSIGDTIDIIKGSHTRRSDIPYNGVKASVRYNNPAAAYPRKSDEKYGLQGYGVLKSGQGTHKIGRFPSAVHGAAANFDLFAEKYEGMTFKAAVAKWRGNTERGEKVVVPSGYNPNEKISKQFLDDPAKAMDFFRKMASHESAGEGGLSKDEWMEAWKMWKAGGANNV